MIRRPRHPPRWPGPAAHPCKGQHYGHLPRPTRALECSVSLGLVVLVFFMARPTGSPGDLYLPIDATAEMRAEFARLHGFDDLLYRVPELSRQSRRARLRSVLAPRTACHRPCPSGVAHDAPVGPRFDRDCSHRRRRDGGRCRRRPNSVFDHIASILSLIGASLPNFWVAIVGVLVFAVNLRWVPTSGNCTAARNGSYPLPFWRSAPAG